MLRSCGVVLDVVLQLCGGLCFWSLQTRVLFEIHTVCLNGNITTSKTFCNHLGHTGDFQCLDPLFPK